MWVDSTDGVRLAVHDLGGIGDHLLISHATGFHGRCYVPLADALVDRYHSTAFDYRGHGDTPLAADGITSWDRYGDDADAMVRWLPTPLRAFGHSMGGACLLMAALREPHRFSRIVVFEPIVFPPDGMRPDGTPSPLAVGARRRRSSFASYATAIENYRNKPPLCGFSPEALEAYVRFGFALGADAQVHLKCLPETEATTFETGGNHATWARLHEITTPVLVISGEVQPMQPSSLAATIAELLPNGEHLELGDLDHFGPMAQPARIADIIAGYLR